MNTKKPLEMAKWTVLRLPEIIAGIALIFAISLTTVNAFTRYFLHFTINGSDEYCIIAFAWMVFPGCAAAYRRKMHYGVDMLVNALPKRVRLFVNLFAQFMVVALTVILTYMSWVLCQNVGSKIMTATRISYVYFDAAMLVGFALMALFALNFLIQDIIALPARLRELKEETK